MQQSVLTSAREPALRTAHFLMGLALAGAFVVMAWPRLAFPFSTAEAGFVHEALVSSGQAMSPPFEQGTNRVPAQVLAVVQQLVGCGERALRLVFLMLVASAGLILAELVSAPRAGSGVVPLLVVLGVTMTPTPRLGPELLVLAPAALALLSAPLAGPVGAGRAILGLLGALACGALGPGAAAVVAAALACAAVIRGSVLDRLGALATGAAAVAAGWVAHGRILVIPSFEGAHWLPRFTWILPGAIGLIAIAILVDPGLRRERLAILIATLVATLPLMTHGPVDSGGTALIPLIALAAASASAAFGSVGGLGVAVGIAVSIVLFLGGADARPDRTALDVLQQARIVAEPGSGLAVAGPRRVEVAVYARLGPAPPMPVIYVPENVPPADLAALCLGQRIGILWMHPAPEPVPPGFSMTESRPAHAPLLVPLRAEKQ